MVSLRVGCDRAGSLKRTARAIRLGLDAKDDAELERLARSTDVSVKEVATRLLREKIREEAFPQLEYRDSAAGRQVYVKGERLTVWQIVMVARHFEMDAALVAEHLEHPLEDIQAALAYAATYPEEIDPIVDEVASTTFEDLKRVIPGLIEARV
jgi:uncharacterized protein (DUF433 family)